MIKNFVFILILLISASSFAKDCEVCLSPAPPGPEARKLGIFSNSISAILNADLNEKNTTIFLDLSLKYLNSIKDKKSFDTSLSEAYAIRLKEIANNGAIAKRSRARAELINSGISGKLAEVKKSPGLGRESFYMLKNSMRLDPTFTDAKMGYVGTIADMVQRNFPVRKLIETTLSVSLKEESQVAMRIIEQQQWLTNPNIKKMYEHLKAFRG